VITNVNKPVIILNINGLNYPVKIQHSVLDEHNKGSKKSKEREKLKLRQWEKMYFRNINQCKRWYHNNTHQTNLSLKQKSILGYKQGLCITKNRFNSLNKYFKL
jgi:hypothetical protein